MALAGLNHKLGWRGTTNTLLNFGEGKFPVRRQAPARSATWSAGPHEGLRCMFHMMNEARIGVGMAAVMLGMAGYYACAGLREEPPAGPAGRTRRARTRRSRRCASSSTPTSSACCWRRSPIAKARWRWSCTARAWSTSSTPATPQAADDARLLLEVLTPIAKSWPSEWCLEANSLAIQVHGGYGYTRDFPVEQYWRDNRLNMIHEGTHGIQAADLLGRKVLMEGGEGLTLLAARISATIERAQQQPELAEYAQRAGRRRWQQVAAATAGGLGHRQPGRGAGQRRALHAGLRPHGGGLDLARRGAGRRARSGRRRSGPHRAGCTPTRYFYRYELPKIGAWLQVAAQPRSDLRATCRRRRSDGFAADAGVARPAGLDPDLRRPVHAGPGTGGAAEPHASASWSLIVVGSRAGGGRRSPDLGALAAVVQRLSVRVSLP